MITRVTNKSTYDRVLKNMLYNAAKLQDLQEKVSSGKRINHPSDDPLGEIKTLDYRTILSSIDHYLGNITYGKTWVNQVDSSMSDMGTLISRAKSLAISQAADTADATTRMGTSVEIGSLYQRIIDLANSQAGENYLFGGSITNQAPFSLDGVYHGNNQRLYIEAGKGVRSEINAIGSNFLATDLNPAISTDAATGGYTYSSSNVTDQFMIDSSNDTLQVMLAGDTGGAPRDVQLTAGVYTGDALATHLQSQIRLLGTAGGVDYGKVTVAYDAATGHFTVDSGDAATNFDTFQNAAGSSARQTLGFSADITGNGDTDVESNTAVAFNVISGVNDSFSVAVDGGAAHSITLTAGTYTAASLVTEMQTQLNTALGAGVVAVDYDTSHSNRFTLTSATTGTTSSVTLLPGTNNFLRMAGLEPDLSVQGTTPTLISDLNAGSGVTLGVINVTDRAGNSANIDLTGATTVADILQTINTTAGVNVTASLNAGKNSIIMTDTNAPPAQHQNLVITDVSGTAAGDLGIAQDVPGNIAGKDLDPAVTERTRISTLYGGQGRTLGLIQVENGGVEGAIDLSGAVSVRDILTRVNANSNSELNISASVMTSGKALDIASSNGSTVALVFDGDDTKSSSTLGIQGEKDILKTFRLLKEALEKNDGHAIQGILQHFDEGLKETLSEHAVIGSSSNKLERAETIQTELQVNTAQALSNTEDADILKTLSDFSLQQTALQVSLQSAARMIQPTLLDFLR